MKKLFILLLATILLSAIAIMPFSSSASEQPTRKIVVFKPGVLSDSAQENLINKFGAVKIKNLDLIGAKVVMVSSRMVAALGREQAVERVDDDVIVQALAKPVKPAPVQPLQETPWGIARINAETAWGTTEGTGINVGIIDTGISNTHPDLSVVKGVNTINLRKSWNDDNGHGSHVAGIIAALNNDIGVVGVGPKINLFAIKVLNSAGSGYLSDIIEGLDWAINNNMQVVNMSLGTDANVLSFEQAVKNAAAAGIVQVAAAGNSGGSVIYPAAYPEVIAVSATDSANAIAYFSSRGPEVDLAAPGFNIYSTYKGTGYNTLSGTSMASPHVAGVAALVVSLPTLCDTDGDNKCSPAEVQTRLQATAEDLGATGLDELYGYGLVNAAAAVGL